MSLAQLAEAATMQAPPQIGPPVPQRIEETGLSSTFLEQLLLKMFYFRGETSGRDLASATGLIFSVIEPLLEHFKRHRLLEAKSSLGMGNISTSFALTDTGRVHARQALEVSQYASYAPVPLSQYTIGVQAQRLQGSWLTKEALAEAYRHMVVTPELLSQIGPAVNAGKSFLIYGQPGNGKTFLAEALFNIQSAPIFIPYAIECQGQIVQLYDPIYHQRIEDDDQQNVFSQSCAYDRRWFRAKRPFIVTGGELTLDMLDLKYSPAAKTYDAPFHLKANNGIYLIDDFGRQRVTPAEVLNRWIVPMERRIDFLTFQTGGKMSVPFECFLVFSTNLKPEQLGDEAFLRRIQYKMCLRNPDEREFAEIFTRFCASKQLPVRPGVLERFLEKRYRRTGKPLRRCQPRDVVSHAIDLLQFERLPFELTDEVLDHAFDSCFVDTSGGMD